MKKMRVRLRANLGELLDEGQYPGTGIGIFDAPGLKSGFDRAKEHCKEVVMSGKNCTADFNLGSGKKVDVKIGYDVGAEFKITPAKGNGTKARKVTITPE